MPATHDVFNQTPPLEGYNLFTSDPVLAGAVAAQGGAEAEADLGEFGAIVGSSEVYRWGFEANDNPPVLKTHDRFGHRSDTVDYHPSYHSLMGLSVDHGIHSLPWEAARHEAAHLIRAAHFYLIHQIEAGHTCPISMTNSVAPSLLESPEIADEWLPRIGSRGYDPSFRPADQKTGVLMGMGMTEKQGGSDVRSNTSVAEPMNGGYAVTGHKWFTSAPMCDAFLILAQAPGGLSCFLLPRWTPDGEVNAIRLQRLKDKLGNRSNASSEMEFDGAWAMMVGEEGWGVRTIIEMVNGTRLDCVIGSASEMRQAVTQAAWHVTHRSAFGAKLIDKPLMQNVVADLEIETEAATLMMSRLAGAFDRSHADPAEAAMKRIALPIAKYWVTKRCNEVVREALECLGGNGYVEESIMPRLYREAPVNAIWEGSGNVIVLDVLRAANRSPDSLETFFSELDSGLGLDARLDDAITAAKSSINAATHLEFEARRLVERLAVAWGGVLLAQHGDDPVFEAYAASRLAGDHGGLYGTLPGGVDAASLARRAVPAA